MQEAQTVKSHSARSANYRSFHPSFYGFKFRTWLLHIASHRSRLGYGEFMQESSEVQVPDAISNESTAKSKVFSQTAAAKWKQVC